MPFLPDTYNRLAVNNGFKMHIHLMRPQMFARGELASHNPHADQASKALFAPIAETVFKPCLRRLTSFLAPAMLLAACGCAGNRVMLDWEARALTFCGKPIQPVALAALARDTEPGAIKLVVRTAEGTRIRDLKEVVDQLDAADLALLMLYFYPAADEDLIALQRETFFGEQLLEQRRQAQLATAARFISTFFAEHGRLPDRSALETWRLSRPGADPLHLVTNEDFIASRGGEPGRDFAIGVWTGYKYYYLQSWDGRHTTYGWESEY